jgi:GNAT superfamily N-acetyltransferase
MEIRELRKDELDLAILPCVDPGFRKTLKQGMTLRKEFLRKKMRKGLSILVALEDQGEKEKIDYPGVGKVRTKDLSLNGKIITGLIEYLPIEKANFPVRGQNLAFIDCIWVIPPFWRKGVAKNLMESFLEKTNTNTLNEMSLRGVPPKAGRRSNLYFSGAAVIAYKKESWWGFFDYMPSWFFQKFGFKQVERDGNSILMFKNYKDAQPPKIILPIRASARLTQPKSTSKSEKIKVELFWSNQCPYSWWVRKLTEKEFGKTSTIKLSFVNTDDKKTLEKFGIGFGLKINDRVIYNRMPSWDEVKEAVKSVKSA